MLAQGAWAVRPQALGCRSPTEQAPQRGGTFPAADVSPRRGAWSFLRSAIPGLGLRPASWANMFRPYGLKKWARRPRNSRTASIINYKLLTLSHGTITRLVERKH